MGYLATDTLSIFRFHVFADRLGTAAFSNVHLGNLLRVPHVGHPRAALLQRPVLFLPAFMQGLRRQLARFAPRIARGVPAVPGARRIHQLPDCFAVYGVALCPETHKLGQWNGILRGYQFQCFVRSQAYHLAALLAPQKAKLPQPGIRLPLAVGPQSQALRNERTHGFRTATPLPQPLVWHLHPVDVVSLVADHKRCGQRKDGGRSDPPRLLERRPGGRRGQSWRQAGGGASSIPTGPGIVRSTPGMHRLALGDSGARGSHGVDFSAAAR